MNFMSKLPAYAPALFWGSIVLVTITTFLVLNGMRVNRGEVISFDPLLISGASLLALFLAYLNWLMDPEILLWIAFVGAVLGTWGAAVDTNRVSDAVKDRETTKRKIRNRQS